MSYDDNNRGALFRNDRRETDANPTHKGEITVAGKAYWLNAWVQTSKAGQKYFSLSVQPKEPKEQKEEPAKEEPEDFNDDIPF